MSADEGAFENGTQASFDPREYEEEKQDLQQESETPGLDSELLALRDELEQLESRVQEEKILNDRAESARRIAQEQKLISEEQINERKAELSSLERDCEELMVEGRMYQLASREYDFPVKETWADKPEQALVVDLSRIVRSLEQATRAINKKGTKSGGSETLKGGEVEVIHANSDGTEVSKTNIPVKVSTTVEEVLNAACAYWSLNPVQCEIENPQGRKLVRRDAVPTDTRQLILKDRLTEGEERALEESEEAQKFSNDNESDDEGGANDQDLTTLSLKPPENLDPITFGDSVQVGRESITKRDARTCYHLEFLLVVLLATTFVSMSLEYRRVFEAFQARETVKRLFADQPVLNVSLPSFTFQEIYAEDRMWLWMSQAASIFAETPILSANCTADVNSTFSISGMTISQLRVAPNTDCAQVVVSNVAEPCFSKFNPPQADVPFTQVPSNPLVQPAFVFNATLQAKDASKCAGWPSLVSDTFPGLYEYYPALQFDAYSLDLTQSSAMEQLALLQSEGWVDVSTRSVSLEFTVFEQSTGTFVNVMAIFEFLPSGAIVPRWISIPFFAQVNDDSYDLAFFILTLILIGINLVVAFFRGLVRFIGPLFLDALLLVFVALYYAGNQQLDAVITQCQTALKTAPGGTLPMDFRGVAFQSQLVGNLMGVIVVLFAIRLTKHLDASPSSSRILRALVKAFPQYLSILFLLAVVSACFAFMAHFIFGRTNGSFYLADFSFASLWISFTIGNSGAYVGVGSWGAIVLSVAAYIVLFLVLFYLCFAVTAAAYINVSDEVRSKGYFWMAGSRAAARYADNVVGSTGAIQGKEAEVRLRNYKAAKRAYGE